MEPRTKLKIGRRSVAAFLILLWCATGLAVTIPADRRPAAWAPYVGIPGGIPDSSTKTIFQTLAQNATITDIKNAYDACPSNQVVFLQAGSYGPYTTQLRLDGSHGAILKGAGIDQTTLTWSTYAGQGILWGPGAGGCTPFNTEVALSSDATQGAFTCEVAVIPSWARPGAILVIDQVDEAWIDATGGGNPAQPGKTYRIECNNTNAAGLGRGLGQQNRVLATNGTTITWELPLIFGYKVAQEAQISQAWIDPTSGSFLMMNGLEEMSLVYTFTAGSDAHPIQGQVLDRCWIKNVEVDNMPSGRVLMYGAYRCEFYGNYIHHSHNHNGGQGYGIALYHYSCANLTQNNIFFSLHNPMSVQFGSMFNVFAYNYQKFEANAAVQTAGMSSHGVHTFWNLWEGNYCDDKVLADNGHGSSSDNTVFRNRVRGIKPSQGDEVCVSLERFSRKWNIVGNCLGDNAHHTLYMSTNDANCSDDYIYKMGARENISCDWDGSPAGDTLGQLDALLQVNYDVVTSTNNGLVQGGKQLSDLEESLYLSAKPAWFGFLSWPPYGPSSAYTNTMSHTNIPAGYRFEFGTNPPAGAGGKYGNRSKKVAARGRVVP